MNNPNKYIGFDIGDKSTTACVIQDGQPERFKTFRSDVPSMQAFLQQQRQEDGGSIHLTFEVSGQAGYFYDHWVDRVDSLTVSNPSQMTWIYRTPKKNDRMDSRKQAVLLSVGEIPAVHRPSREGRQWRMAIQHRKRLVEQGVVIKNRIRTLLKSQGYKRPIKGCSGWTQAHEQWMKEVADKGPLTRQTLWRLGLKDLLDGLELVDKQVAALKRYLDGYLAKQAGWPWLRSIPGVGPRTAEAVLAHTDEVKRFGRGKEYGAYFGLTPKLDESGDSRRIGHISKQGPSVVRGLLVESAWRAIRSSEALRKFYERVTAGHPARRKIAIVAVARKRAVIRRAVLLHGCMYDESLVGGGKE